MNEYSHQLSGFFANREEAQSVFTTLIERGVPRERLQLFDTGRLRLPRHRKKTATLC